MNDMINQTINNWRLEVEIIRQLDLDLYNDESLKEEIQKRINDKLGLKHTGFFIKRTWPKVYCKTQTLKMAHRVLDKDDARILFWSNELGNTVMEQQWLLDLKYVKKYKKHGLIDWNIHNFVETIIMKGRKEDRNVIDKHVPNFIKTRKSYVYFHNKAKTQNDKIIMEQRPPPINPYVFSEPSAPLL